MLAALCLHLLLRDAPLSPPPMQQRASLSDAVCGSREGFFRREERALPVDVWRELRSTRRSCLVVWCSKRLSLRVPFTICTRVLE